MSQESNKTSKWFLFGLLLVSAVIVIGLLLSLTGGNNPGVNAEKSADGKTQTVTILAKNGYSPHTTNAEANTPTILKVNTNNTFDCSSSLVIPALNINKNLPSNESVEINIPPQARGSKITGSCSMGMYSFDIKFI